MRLRIVGLRIPERVHSALKEMARESGLTMSVLVERMVMDYLDRLERGDFHKIETSVTLREDVYERLREKSEELEVEPKRLLGYLVSKVTEGSYAV